MPLTNLGFQRKSYDEILADLTEKVRILFSEEMDTSETSTFGKLIRLIAQDSANTQELAEQVYLSGFVGTASGVSLDRLAALAGISRNPASRAMHTIRVKGVSGTIVPMGFIVAAGNVYFHTVNSSRIASSGYIDITVECNDIGPVGNVPVGAIDSIVNPASGINSIIHTAVESLGTETETDYSLRSRMTKVQSDSDGGTIDAIRSAVLKVAGVEACFVEENNTSQTIGSLPPHSFRVYVTAPPNVGQTIANAIFSKKPAGIQTIGSSVYYVEDLGEGLHSVNFTFTDTVPVYVKCSVDIDSSFDADISIAQIKDNIVKKLSDYFVGQNVTATSLYSSVYVEGVEDVTNLTIGKSSAQATNSRIEIDIGEIARSDPDYIEVNINE